MDKNSLKDAIGRRRGNGVNLSILIGSSKADGMDAHAVSEEETQDSQKNPDLAPEVMDKLPKSGVDNMGGEVEGEIPNGMHQIANGEFGVTDRAQADEVGSADDKKMFSKMLDETGMSPLRKAMKRKDAPKYAASAKSEEDAGNY